LLDVVADGDTDPDRRRPAAHVYGNVSYRITARCSLVEDLQLDDTDRLAYLAVANERATMFAYVHNPDLRTIDACCAFTAHAGNESLLRVFSGAVVLIANLARRINEVAAHFGGSAVRVPHPISGVREDDDELAYFGENVIVPRGNDLSPFADDTSDIDFTTFPGCAYQTGSDGVGAAQAELAFYHNVPALLARNLGWPLGTSLV